MIAVLQTMHFLRRPFGTSGFDCISLTFLESLGQGVRIDTAIYSGYTIPSYYDSMIAKLIVHADTREDENNYDISGKCNIHFLHLPQ